MIGVLPKVLEVSGKQYPIRSDFRVVLLIFQAYNDAELSEYEKMMVCLRCLFEEVPEDLSAAIKAAVWFLDGGNMPKSKEQGCKLMDWEQDEGIIFPAINKVAGYETRGADYLHWWTFLGFFNEIGEGLFATVVGLRQKRAKHKPLEKWEREFYNEHKDMIDIREKYSEEEQAEIDRLNRILG